MAEALWPAAVTGCSPARLRRPPSEIPNVPLRTSICQVNSPRKPSCRHIRGPATSPTVSGTLRRSCSNPYSCPSPCMWWNVPECASLAGALTFAMSCPSSAHSLGQPWKGHGAGPTPSCTESQGLRAPAPWSRAMGTGGDTSISCEPSGQEETQTRDPFPALPPCPLGHEPQSPPTGQELSLQPPRMTWLREPRHHRRLSLNFNLQTPKHLRQSPACVLCT